MGRRGATAESYEEMKERGNPGKRKPPKDEATNSKKTGEPFLPPPPKNLDKFAKAEWINMSTEMAKFDSLCATDLSVFEFYCQAVGDVRRLREYLKDNGRYVTHRNNTHTPRPEVKELAEAQKAVQKWAPLLGLTTSARIGLKLKPRYESNKSESDSELSEIFD